MLAFIQILVEQDLKQKRKGGFKNKNMTLCDLQLPLRLYNDTFSSKSIHKY